MNQLKNLIKNLNEEDLLKIKKDLEEGNIQRLINKKINQLNLDKKRCPVCGEKINTESFYLEFGKDYLRKKAYFDGADCLEYFLNKKIKRIKT